MTGVITTIITIVRPPHNTLNRPATAPRTAPNRPTGRHRPVRALGHGLPGADLE
jgi:hypothetical protein